MNIRQIFLTLFLLFSLGSSLWAQSIQEKLNLTPEQKQQFRATRVIYRHQITALNNKLLAEFHKLKAEWKSARTNKKRNHAFRQRMNAIRRQMRIKNHDYKLAVREYLTDEQKEIWDTEMAKRRYTGR